MSVLARLAAAAAGIVIVNAVAACGTVTYSQVTGNLRVPVFSFRGQLDSVAAASPDDAWAVGFSGSTITDGGTLMLHWDGRTWSRVASLQVLDGVPGVLSDVTAVSDSDAWAVGVTAAASASGESAGAGKPLLVHWDGSRWSQVAGLPAVNGSLSAITMSSHSGWAVGSFVVDGHPRPLILRWDGAVWRQEPAPAGVGDLSLAGVAVSSAGTAWAIGDAPVEAIGEAPVEGSFATVRSVLLRWSGSSWQRVSFPLAGPANWLSDMAVGPDGTAWAVGQDATATALNIHTNAPPLSMRWTGATWQAMPVPGPKGGFYGVTIAPGGAVWAVGGDAIGAVAMRWTGSAWDSVPVPEDLGPAANGTLNGVAFSSPADGWAVGVDWVTGRGARQENLPLIVHWDGTAWN
jgi:hypothetical protein